MMQRHARTTSGEPKRPFGPHQQDAEDDRERHEDRQVGADEADVVARQRLGDADDPAADDRALGRVEAAERGGRERVDEHAAHEVDVEEQLRRDEHAGERAEQRREPPADHQRAPDVDADEPARRRVGGRRAHRQPELRAVEEQEQQPADHEQDATIPSDS